MPSDIEHILPQTPAKGWKAFSKDERDALTHTLANLIPLTTKMNSGVSNDPYAKKRKRFRQSGFKTPRKIAKDYDTWTPSDIADLAQILSEWAVKRWPDPFSQA